MKADGIIYSFQTVVVLFSEEVMIVLSSESGHQFRGHYGMMSWIFQINFQLDEIANEARALYSNGSCASRTEAVCQIMLQKGFQGALADDYYDPNNSDLECVLSTTWVNKGELT